MTKSSGLSQRRTLRFDTIDDAIREAERIAEADRRGNVKRLGNWSPGQCMGHVATWIDYGYNGYPMKPLPWVLRAFLGWRVKKYLKTGMPSGVRMPGVKDGTFGVEDMPTTDALDRYRRAFLRLKSRENAPYDSPAFGPMSHDDRIALNLRHAELHLGFLEVVDE
ncbi:MAG: DUF1569 domain-containing protein [Phycisphaerales bacterium]|nr:DUF1569 domain-containing protein [Phycisphaerales bacterium]MCB9854402.1 DUF1569 domain-containing protein [Phycisphaerales bacterium]MCB9863603.1 DUF1569 domain-containing protein [Phycisphaerales bacterium]